MTIIEFNELTKLNLTEEQFALVEQAIAQETASLNEELAGYKESFRKVCEKRDALLDALVTEYADSRNEESREVAIAASGEFTFFYSLIRNCGNNILSEEDREGIARMMLIK